MVKILLFSPLALEYGRGGELSLIELASGLKKFHNIEIVDTNRILGQKNLSLQSITKKLGDIKRDRLKFAWINFNNKNISFPYPLDVLRLYKKIKKTDIVYFSTGNIKVILIFLLYRFLNSRIKFIIGHRLPLSSEKRISLYNLRILISLKILSKFKKRLYHHTISYHAKKYLENFFPKERITHILHCIDLKNYKESFIERNRDETLRFIYVGSLDNPHKGFGFLLKALKELFEKNSDLNVIFEFCGQGPLKAEIKNLENQFPKSVKFHGYISNDKIADYYKKNHVLIFTSIREPFGRVIIEALAAGLLIICNKTIGSVEILKGKDFAFFLDNLNPQEINKKIIKLSNFWEQNPVKFKDLQKKARNYAFKEYEFSNELRDFNELIKKVIK